MRFLNPFLLTALAVLTCTFSFSDKGIAADMDFKSLPSSKYVLDKTHASLTWKVMHMGLSNYTARFTDFDANIEFNADAPETSTVMVSVNPMSVETDYPNSEKKDFDKEIASSEQWFNAGEYPNITFKSTALTINDDHKTGELQGELTFLGVTKPLSLDVTLNGVIEKHPFAKRPALGFSARGVVKRSEWGLNTYVPNISDDVSVIIEAEFIQAEITEGEVEGNGNAL